MSRLISVLAAAVLYGATIARADVPQNITIQGKLADSTGAPVAVGPKTFTYFIFDTESGGVEIWPGDAIGESQSITTDANGLWTAQLGAVVPLTEAVFQDTSRWLEVTVSDGVNPAETLPRIKLNTNPYAYRAATAQASDSAQFALSSRYSDTSQYSDHALQSDTAQYAHAAANADTAQYVYAAVRADSVGNADSLGGLPGSEYVRRAGDVMYGALGTPELNVGDSASSGELNVWANGVTSPVVNAGSVSGGGFVSLFDETGTNSTIDLSPDADGTGGYLSVRGGGSGFFFVDGNASGGTSDPQVWIAGPGSYTLFDANQIADGSVQMSADAISAPEIADEPGIATGPRSDVPGVAILTTVASATATFPKKGYAVVICEATFRTLTANIYITGRLFENSVEQGFWFWEAGDVDNFPDLRQTYVFTDSVASGSHTYELRVVPSAGSVDVVHAKVTVLYFPTNYGTVFSPTAAGDPPDVESERAMSIAANQARIDREMDHMRAEIAELRELLMKGNQTADTDR